MRQHAARDFAARAEAGGLGYLDARISGGAVRAAAGELTIIASGKAAVFTQVRPVLNGITAKVYELAKTRALVPRSRLSTSWWPGSISPPRARRSPLRRQ